MKLRLLVIIILSMIYPKTLFSPVSPLCYIWVILRPSPQFGRQSESLRFNLSLTFPQSKQILCRAETSWNSGGQCPQYLLVALECTLHTSLFQNQVSPSVICLRSMRKRSRQSKRFHDACGLQYELTTILTTAAAAATNTTTTVKQQDHDAR